MTDMLAPRVADRHSRTSEDWLIRMDFRMLPMGRTTASPFSRFLKIACFLLVFLAAGLVKPALAADLPLAAGSPLAGFAFDDRPLLLPVQRNFQMAMLTASSELGRSCGHMEAYGWRLKQSEQQRVDQIFNNTVDRLRGLGYVIEMQSPVSVSRDITMFTADRPDKHFIFMWSAGEIGLAMVLCQSSGSLSGRTATAQPSVQIFPQNGNAIEEAVLAPPPSAMQLRTRRAALANFSPVGDWIGSYTCEQGYTGGTLQIAHLNGENFDGIFRFYPTPKNPYVPTGRYEVYGQYDRQSHRILINPGKWLERPQDFYNTVMVGEFDPVAHTLSAYFQGISGCTSFEARYAHEDYQGAAPAKHVKKKTKKKPVQKISLKAKPAVATGPLPAPSPAVTAPVVITAPEATPEATSAPTIITGTPTPTPTPTPAAEPAVPPPSSVAAPAPSAAPILVPLPPAAAPAPVTEAPMPLTPPSSASSPEAAPATAPASPSPTATAPAASPPEAVPLAPATTPAAAPTPSTEPASIILPAPTSTGTTPSSEAPSAVPVTPPSSSQGMEAAPAQTAPPEQMAPPQPTPAPNPTAAPNPVAPPSQPSGAIEPKKAKLIQLASLEVAESGQWITPITPQAPPAQIYNTNPPVAPTAPTAPPAQQALPAVVLTPVPPQVPAALIATPATVTIPEPPQVPPAEVAPPAAIAPEATRFVPVVPPVPPAQQVPDTGKPY